MVNLREGKRKLSYKSNGYMKAGKFCHNCKFWFCADPCLCRIYGTETAYYDFCYRWEDTARG